MKALVYDVKAEEIIHLIQEARESKEAYLGQHSPLSMAERGGLKGRPVMADVVDRD